MQPNFFFFFLVTVSEWLFFKEKTRLRETALFNFLINIENVVLKSPCLFLQFVQTPMQLNSPFCFFAAVVQNMRIHGAL